MGDVQDAQVVLGGYWLVVQCCSWGPGDALESQWDAREMLGEAR